MSESLLVGVTQGRQYKAKLTTKANAKLIFACLVEVLPLVEFFLEDDITDEEAMQLLESEHPRRKNPDKQDGWRQETTARILKRVQRVNTYITEILETTGSASVRT